VTVSRLRGRVAAGLLVLAGALAIALLTGAPPLASLRPAPRMPLRAARPDQFIVRDFLTDDSLHLSTAQILKPSRGTLLLLHGLGHAVPAAERWAPGLAEATGLNVIAFPLRSAGVDLAEPGDVRHLDDAVRDVAAVTRELRKRNPSGPIVLLGIGVGGGLAVRYLERRDAVAGPAVEAVILDRAALTRDALRVAPGLPFGLVWHERRAAVLDLLARAHVTAFDRLPVAYEPVESPIGPTAQAWTARALAAMVPRDAWRTLRSAPEAVLFLSPWPPAPEWYRRTDRHEWAASDTAGPTAPRVQAAIVDFLIQFAEAAAERKPIPPTTPLPVLPRR